MSGAGWLNFNSPQNGCHPELGESRARDLTFAEGVTTVDRIARAPCSSKVPRIGITDLRGGRVPPRAVALVRMTSDGVSGHLLDFEIEPTR